MSINDKKASELITETTILKTDKLYILKDPSGTPLSRVATIDELLKDVFESIFGVSLTEISYVDGVTSSIQTQLNSKVNKNGDTMTGSLLINNSTDSDSDTDDILLTGLTACHGILTVAIISDDKTAVYRVDGQSLTTISAHSDFSTSKDTSNKYNIYWENDQFKVQNKFGDSKVIKIGFIGV